MREARKALSKFQDRDSEINSAHMRAINQLKKDPKLSSKVSALHDERIKIWSIGLSNENYFQDKITMPLHQEILYLKGRNPTLLKFTPEDAKRASIRESLEADGGLLGLLKSNEGKLLQNVEKCSSVKK